MHDREHLQVELYAHGGWWKDSVGRSGQVPESLARKGPLATVAALANSFALDGWKLTDFASAQHNSYWLSFELATTDGLSNGDARGTPGRSATICLG